MRQIESYNAHALEAFAVGTVLYLFTGVALGLLLTRLGPKPVGQPKRVSEAAGAQGGMQHER